MGASSHGISPLKRQDLALNDFAPKDLRRNTEASPWIKFGTVANYIGSVHLLHVDRDGCRVECGEYGSSDG